MKAYVVPYMLKKGGENGTQWVAECKFCSFVSQPHDRGGAAAAEGTEHARHPHEGDHYDPISGLYYSPSDLAYERERRRQHRQILGSPEDTERLNQAGL